MHAKLKEMDHTFEDLRERLVKQDALLQTNTLLVLMSDHGMNLAGNHGGSTTLEAGALAYFTDCSETHTLPLEELQSLPSPPLHTGQRVY